MQVVREGISGGARQANVTLPGPPTQTGLLRVQGINANFAAASELVEIKTTAASVVTVISPNTRIVWHVGDIETITWAVTGAFQSFTVQLSRDAGHTWETIFTNLNGATRQVSYAVDPPHSNNCRVRVQGHGPGASDTSDQTFEIRI